MAMALSRVWRLEATIADADGGSDGPVGAGFKASPNEGFSQGLKVS